MKTWISVSAAEDERVGRRFAMLRRRKDAFLTLFMCDLNASVGSMMMPRFLTRGEGVTE